MSWFRKQAERAPESCSFCAAPRDQCRLLVATGIGGATAICDRCVVLSAAVMGESAQASGVPSIYGWALVVGEMAATCGGDDAPRVVEPLARAACALSAGDPALLRGLADRLHARDGVAFARALAIVYEALSGHGLTARDAGRAVTAALLAGELDAAAAIRPAAAADLANRGWMLVQHLVALMRAPAGSPVIEGLLGAVTELHRDLDEDDPEALLAVAGTTEAYAHVRAHHPALAIKRYAPYRKDPLLRPWHAIALGDALEATGDLTGAQELWRRVARRAEWEPYWPEQARERLARERAPYR